MQIKFRPGNKKSPKAIYWPKINLLFSSINRKDMIDDALMRPGRLEVQIEIGLPKETGRIQILGIHTRKMVANGKLANDVDINELAKMTKNFSGAEIEGLVRAAQSTSMNRLIKVPLHP